MSGVTPGPWRWRGVNGETDPDLDAFDRDGDFGSHPSLVGADGSPVISCPLGWSGEYRLYERVEDARAIERVPDLLDVEADFHRLLDAVREMSDAHNLGEAIYHVREETIARDPDFEGNAWDHPRVTQYNHGFMAVTEILKKYPKGGE